MSYTIISLAGFITWTICLLVVLAVYRTQFASKQKRGLKFKSDGSDVDALGERITRAHANCFESFSFVGGTMLLALATSSGAITDSLALVVLAARIGQSLVHIASTSTLFIQLRFLLFLAQVLICLYWLVLIFIKFL